MAGGKIVATALKDAELQIYLAEFFIHPREQTLPRRHVVVLTREGLQFLDRQIKTPQADHQPCLVYPGTVYSRYPDPLRCADLSRLMSS